MRTNKEEAKKYMDFDDKSLDALFLEAMSDDFSIKIPEDFADRLEKKAQQINLNRFWQEEILKQASLLGGILFLIAVAFGIFYYFQPQNAINSLAFLNQIKLILIGGVVLFFGVQLADTWVFKSLGKNQNY